MKVGDHVLVHMGGAHAGAIVIPLGARVLDTGPPLWIDACIMGQHLPQMYRPEECVPLDVEAAKAAGLCPACLGYGSHEIVLELGAGIDEISDPCGACGGSGRPSLRVEITREGGDVSAVLTTVPHDHVGTDDECLACGGPRDAAHHGG